MSGELLLAPDIQTARELRMFCLPHAGGGSAPFFRWRPLAPEWLQVVPWQLPGRETRLSDPPYRSLTAMISDLADALIPYPKEPYVLLGHSLGSLISFELIRELRRRGERLPKQLIVAACRPPQLIGADTTTIHKLPDAEFVTTLDMRYGGISPKILDNPELLRLLLPSLRADVEILETYEFVENEPLDVEILALGGQEDQVVTQDLLSGWQRHTTGPFSLKLLPGGHFFMINVLGGQSAKAFRTIVEHLQQTVVEP